MPLLRLLVGQKRGQRSDGGRILFYIHFPDLLLARGRARWWKRLYRLPFDALEPWSMGFADALAVNSAFTRSVVADTWPRLAAERTLEVVYPCVEVPEDETNGSGDEKGKEGRQSIAGKATKDGRQEKDAVKTTDEAPPLVWPTPPNTRILLSINRFERKKDIGLALRAFAALPQHLIAPRRSPNTQSSTSKSSSPPPTARLVIAGGYDARVQENVQYHQELCQLAESLGLSHATARTVPSALTAASSPVPHPSQGPSDTPAPPQVLFLLSVPSALKSALLRSATCLLYTPRNEHFGIVPLEAMAAGVPVLAADSGGPRETVVDGVTGWLRDPDDLAAWADVLETVVTSGDDATARADGRRGMTEKQRREMGQAGRRRVRENFSAGSMARRLDDVINDMLAAPPVSRAGAGWLGGIALVLAGTAVAVLGVAVAVVLGRS